MTEVHAIKMDQRALVNAQRATHSPQRDVLAEVISHLTLPQIDSSLRRRGDGMKLYRLKPNCARMTDYWLGGYHNFAIDRLAARHVGAILPEAPEIWREQRRFLQRAVTYMARELGLNHFIDFGSGLPTRGNVHEIVQAINPATKVIYSDINLTCVTQAQEILDGNPNVRYVQCAFPARRRVGQEFRYPLRMGSRGQLHGRCDHQPGGREIPKVEANFTQRGYASLPSLRTGDAETARTVAVDGAWDSPWPILGTAGRGYQGERGDS